MKKCDEAEVATARIEKITRAQKKMKEANGKEVGRLTEKRTEEIVSWKARANRSQKIFGRERDEGVLWSYINDAWTR